MNLIFRLIFTLIHGFFRSKKHMGDLATFKSRVYLNDLDINMHMNNGRYLTLMDLARVDLMLRSKLIKIVVKERWYPVVGGINIKFIRSLQPFQKFEIRTQVITWNDKWIYLQQDFYAKEKLYCSAMVKALFIGNGKALPSKILLDKLGNDVPVKQDLTEEKKQWIQSV